MKTNRYTIKLYWQQVKKYKISFFIALFCIPIAGLTLDTILPYFLSQSIGSLSVDQQDLTVKNIVISIIVAILGFLFNFIGFQYLVRHEANIRYELSQDTFRRLLSKDLSFFANEKIGALTSRYIDFLRSHVTLQDLLIMRTLGFVLSVVIGMIIVGMQSPILALVLAILLIAIVLEVKYSIKYRAKYRHARKELISESNGKVADALTNSLIIKTFANEKNEINHLNSVNDSYRTAFIKDLRLMSLEGSLRILAMSTVQIVAIVICAALVTSKQMDIPTAIFMLVYLQRIASQLFNLGEMLTGYDQALLEAGPMSDMLAKKIAVNDKPEAYKLNNINPTIELRNVSYKYDDNPDNILNDINLSIRAGEKIGLIGHSGTGKTTITHLLLRFADVTNGSILIDGHDIRDVTQKSLRQSIAYVPQEPMLFHRSLRDNITYGKINATESQIRDAIHQANASEFINKLPDGIDTTVGERGVKLSGGQRQRIAIARAILKDAPILVLDEATSALDSESEKLIQESLTGLMKGRTSIVIAHRLSTIAKLDRIVVLSGGQIAEQGTHNQLLLQNGIYAKLWSHQSGGFIEE